MRESGAARAVGSGPVRPGACWRWHATAATLYALGALLVTYPVAADFTTRLAGNNGDVFLFTWDAWWLCRVVSEGRDPFWTPYLYFPDGASLAFHTLAAPLTGWSILFFPHVGPIAFYNVVLLLALFASAMSAYVLALYVTRTPAAAFLAGVIFGFCPNRLDQARGHPDIVAGLWLPLMVLPALSLLHADSRCKRVAAAIGAGTMGVLGLLTRPEHAISGFYLIALLYGGAWLRRRTSWKRTTGGYLAILACTVVIGSPYLLRVLRAGAVPRSPNYEVEQIAKGVSAERILLPPRDSLLWGWWSAGAHVNQIYASPGKVAFLGYAVVALLVAGCVSARGSPAWWTWLASGLFFLLVSFGAELLLFEQSTGIRLLYRFLPDIGAMRAPNRFMPAAMLCLGVASAIAWDRLLRSLQRPGVGTAVTILLATVLLLEYASLPFPTIRPAMSPFYERLAAEPDEFGLVEFPQQSRLQDKLYMFYQTVHGKPLHAGHLSRRPWGTATFLTSVDLLRALSRDPGLGRPRGSVDVAADLRRLRGHRFRYLIFHKRFDEEMFDGWSDSEARVAAEVARISGDPVYEDDLLVAFDLRRVPPDGDNGAGHSSSRSPRPRNFLINDSGTTRSTFSDGVTRG